MSYPKQSVYAANSGETIIFVSGAGEKAKVALQGYGLRKYTPAGARALARLLNQAADVLDPPPIYQAGEFRGVR